MVRTRADNTARKAVAAKAPRKALGSNSSGGAGSSSGGATPAKVGKYAGGNAVCPRPTPDWQKGIGSFLVKSTKPEGKENKPEEETEEDVEVGESSGSGSMEGSSSGASSAAAAAASSESPSPVKSPVKRNGIIDSDEDDE